MVHTLRLRFLGRTMPAFYGPGFIANPGYERELPIAEAEQILQDHPLDFEVVGGSRREGDTLASAPVKPPITTTPTPAPLASPVSPLVTAPSPVVVPKPAPKPVAATATRPTAKKRGL